LYVNIRQYTRTLNQIDDDILLFINLLLIQYYDAIIRCSSRKQFFAEVSKNLARYRSENNFIRPSKLLYIL